MSQAKPTIRTYDEERLVDAEGAIQRWVRAQVALESIVDRLYDWGLTGWEIVHSFVKIYGKETEVVDHIRYQVWELFMEMHRDPECDRYGRRH